MPGVIQPQRSQGSLQTMLSLGQTAMAAKSAFGGGGQVPQQTTTAATAGQVGDASAAAQGQAVPQSQSMGQLGDYPSDKNVFQRGLMRRGSY